MNSLTFCPAATPPYPPCSTRATKAILGFSLGKYPASQEWFIPLLFCAVPVLAETFTSALLKICAVPWLPLTGSSSAFFFFFANI